jgi:hypothetical protein
LRVKSKRIKTLTNRKLIKRMRSKMGGKTTHYKLGSKDKIKNNKTFIKGPGKKIKRKI